jgi:hypothetical protein
VIDLLKNAFDALGFSKSPESVLADARNGILLRGHFYRVWAKVDELYVNHVYESAPPPLGQTTVQEQLANDLSALGFAHAALVVQDPSDPEVWTFLARWMGTESAKPPSEAGPIRFTRFDPVEEPAPLSPRVDVPSLDVGLTEDNLYGIRYALAHDDDPKRLAGLARSFDEDFPIAASLLRNKARLEDLNRCVNRETGPVRVAERSNGTLSPLSSTDHSTLDTLKAAAHDVDAGEHLDIYANVFNTLGWTAPEHAVEHGQGLLFTLEPQLAGLPAAEREEGFGKIVTLLSRTPSLATVKNIPSLVEKTGLPTALVAAGVATVAHHGHGLVTLDPEIVRAMQPQGPRPVSVGALKMAFAVLRPEGSLAAAPTELGDVLSDLHKAVRSGDAFAIKADESLKRARRSLDRQNWVAWYKRYHAAEAM